MLWIRIGIETIPILLRILPKFYKFWKIRFFVAFSHTIATLQFFISLIKVLNMSVYFSILDSNLEFFGKKFYFINFFHLFEIDTDPDPQRWPPVP